MKTVLQRSDSLMYITIVRVKEEWNAQAIKILSTMEGKGSLKGNMWEGSPTSKLKDEEETENPGWPKYKYEKMGR